MINIYNQLTLSEGDLPFFPAADVIQSAERLNKNRLPGEEKIFPEVQYQLLPMFPACWPPPWSLD